MKTLIKGKELNLCSAVRHKQTKIEDKLKQFTIKILFNVKEAEPVFQLCKPFLLHFSKKKNGQFNQVHPESNPTSQELGSLCDLAEPHKGIQNESIHHPFLLQTMDISICHRPDKRRTTHGWTNRILLEITTGTFHYLSFYSLINPCMPRGTRMNINLFHREMRTCDQSIRLADDKIRYSSFKTHHYDFRGAKRKNK